MLIDSQQQTLWWSSQGRSGACLLIWGEWALSAGDFPRGQYGSEVAGPVQEDYGLRPMSVYWWAHGIPALQDSHHNSRWVSTIILPPTTCPSYFFLFLHQHSSHFFQWEVQFQCPSASHPPRRRWTTITDFTWRACPSCSMNTRSAVDFLKLTSFWSSRLFSSSTWTEQLLLTAPPPSGRSDCISHYLSWLVSLEAVKPITLSGVGH